MSVFHLGKGTEMAQLFSYTLCCLYFFFGEAYSKWKHFMFDAQVWLNSSSVKQGENYNFSFLLWKQQTTLTEQDGIWNYRPDTRCLTATLQQYKG